MRYGFDMSVRVEERFRKYFGVEKWSNVEDDSVRFRGIYFFGKLLRDYLPERLNIFWKADKHVTSNDCFQKNVQWSCDAFPEEKIMTVCRLFLRCSRVEKLKIDLELIRKLEKAKVFKTYITGIVIGELCANGMLDDYKAYEIF